MKFLLLFTALTLVNVVLQTLKSIATVKCGKVAAATVNAVAYALYTYLIIFTAADGMSLHMKALITALANFVGVWVVKFFEEKARKDRLWEIKVTIPNDEAPFLCGDLSREGISFNCIENVGKYVIFNIYSENQEQSLLVKQALSFYNAKYFVSESKTL